MNQLKLFQPHLMAYEEQTIDWKTAIELGVDLLVQANLSTPDLTKAILEQTKLFGAYYVLEPGIALLHAPIGPYALGVGISVLLLKTPIVFNNQLDKQAHLIFTLVTPDATSHIGLIEQFGNYFSDENWKQEMLQASNLATLFNLIQEKERE